jgi:Coenzyme PQQ synthesis protein D (PqqD)
LAEHPQLWTRSTDVAVVDDGDRVVVLDLRALHAAHPLVMEGPAAAIWHALSQRRTAEQVTAAVAVDFGLPATEVEADVVTFLATLQERGLATVSPLADTEPGPT